jgi:hypothetical protein
MGGARWGRPLFVRSEVWRRGANRLCPTSIAGWRSWGIESACDGEGLEGPAGQPIKKAARCSNTEAAGWVRPELALPSVYALGKAPDARK